MPARRVPETRVPEQRVPEQRITEQRSQETMLVSVAGASLPGTVLLLRSWPTAVALVVQELKSP